MNDIEVELRFLDATGYVRKEFTVMPQVPAPETLVTWRIPEKSSALWRVVTVNWVCTDQNRSVWLAQVTLR